MHAQRRGADKSGSWFFPEEMCDGNRWRLSSPSSGESPSKVHEELFY